MTDKPLKNSKIYMDNILDHYKNPRHKGEVQNFTSKHAEVNTLCGDKISITVTVNDDILQDAKFDGVGCAISQASISMILEEVIGKTKDEVLAIDKNNVEEMLGIELGPVRLKCALLGLEALHKAINGD